MKTITSLSRLRGVLLLLALCSASVSVSVGADTYRAAAAKVVITPDVPLWAGGYGHRKEPVFEKVHDLFAKALVVEDAAGKRLLFLSLETENIPVDFAEAVAAALHRRFGLPREQIVITCTHTHCGPVLASPEAKITYGMNEGQLAATERYTKALEDKLAGLAAEAIGRLAPASLSHGLGQAGFGVNRRNNKEGEIGQPDFKPKGPTDHDVPVLRVAAADGSVMAVLFGYACHCTTMDFYQWCGDYAGFAQLDIEREHPGAIALFLAGCGADINPLPRRKLELAAKYGRELADAVGKVLATNMTPIEGAFGVAFTRVDLAFDKLPTRLDLERQRSEGSVYEKKRAELLIAEVDNGRPLSPTYPYPVQTLRLGHSLIMVMLGGETLVDYSLRLKRELGPGRIWVFGYANDLCAYMPSERVLKEGGYEGGEAMVYTGMPSAWAPGLEDRIIEAVRRLVRQVQGSQ